MFPINKHLLIFSVLYNIQQKKKEKWPSFFQSIAYEWFNSCYSTRIISYHQMLNITFETYETNPFWEPIRYFSAKHLLI